MTNGEVGRVESRGKRQEYEIERDIVQTGNTERRTECGGVKKESGRGSAGVGRVAERSIAAARQRVELSGKH